MEVNDRDGCLCGGWSSQGTRHDGFGFVSLRVKKWKSEAGLLNEGVCFNLILYVLLICFVDLVDVFAGWSLWYWCDGDNLNRVVVIA